MSSVTNQTIDNRIDTVIYHRLPGTTVTICQIKMVNGFVVLGESACVNPADYDQEEGESIAHENAREKLWSLEGSSAFFSADSAFSLARLARASAAGSSPFSRLARSPSHATIAAGADMAGQWPILILRMRPSTGLLYR